MAECKKMMELVSAYVDGECSEEEAAELKKHLDECASCRALLAVYQSIGEELSETGVEPPAALKDGVMERLRKEPVSFPGYSTGVKTKKFNYSAFIKIAAAAACIALVIYAAPRFLKVGKSTANESQMYAKMDTGVSGNASAPAAMPSTQIMDDARSGSEEEAAAEAPQAAPAPADGGGLNGEQGDSTESPREEIMVSSSVPSLSPSPSPSSSSSPTEPGMTYFTQAGSGEGKAAAYYATITISGELPEVLAEYEKTDAGDGTVHIVIPAETAKLLIEDLGYTVDVTNENAAEALVIYSEN